MVSAPPTPRDIQVLSVGADTLMLRSCSWTRLKFEVEYALQRGTTSNSFLIKGDKVALRSLPGESFTELFLEQLQQLVLPAELDYVILGHINPNRFATLEKLLQLAPHLIVVCSNPGAITLRALLEAAREKNSTDSTQPIPDPELYVVKGQETLDLGKGHRLELIPTPTPRWPDGICAYDPKTAILYSDKFFGAHVAGEQVYDDGAKIYEADRKYYYDCLMATQISQVETSLERLAPWSASAQIYAPVNGPLLRQGALEIFQSYQAWNHQQATQTLSVAMLYASAYGNTAILSQAIAHGITKAGVAVETINCEHISPEEIREVISRTDGFIIGSPTLGGHAPTPIQTALGIILATAEKSKLAGVFGSYGWSGEAIDLLEEKLKNAGYSFGFAPIRVKFTPSDAILQQCEEAGTDFAQALKKAKKVKQVARPLATPVEQAVGRLVGSLSIVTAQRGDATGAMVASWIAQASFNPPGLTVAVAKDRAIESLLYPGDQFVLNLLEEGKHIPLMKHFLKPFGPGEDRFVGIETKQAQSGLPILKDALSYLECRVQSRMDCGDHWLVYCTAEAGDVFTPSGKAAVHYRTTGTHY
jgi:flavorubredoxin/flavin reductase (DIM6/NTAB) family NADH-FMN oxidoreductase RutF